MAATTLASLALRAATSSTISTASKTGSSTATSTSAAGTDSRPPVYHVVGIILAISSGLFIGVSFVIKKIGLLKANKKYHEEAGEGYGYLKNSWWWMGMSLMIVGEICNFVAYAFVDAILVTPMGSLSVVISTILSSIFLKERLSFVGWVGCFLCIIGSIIIVVNAPQNSAVATIQQMQHYVIAPGFLSYAGVILVGCAVIAWWAGPRYGKKSMLVYLSICSLIGGLSVVATQGLGAAIVAQIGGTQQFNQWFLYVLFVFVIGTLLTEIVYLNKALNIFNASIVTPTYYVYFTSSTIVTSAILFQGLHGTVMQIVTLVLGFLVICSGVVLLQLSKSAKDVPDTAVFKGDLDQIRTMAEVEEPNSEPKADAIRGGAALLRSLSKSRLRKEAEEAERIQQERLEPIGEDEQVEWDGLRRRKTVLLPGQTSIKRHKTVHPPLGLTRFPDEDSDNESRQPEDDIGIFPTFRKRMRSQRSGRTSTMSTENSTRTSSGTTGTVPLTTMTSPNRKVQVYANDGFYEPDVEDDADLTSQRIGPYTLPTDLKHSTSIGLSTLQDQDTSYKSPSPSARAISWAPPPSHIDLPPTPSSRGKASTPGPTPPPHGKRQFSFQHVFQRGASPSRASAAAAGGDEDSRPMSAKSQSSFGSRVFGSVRKSSGLGLGGRTEEERLGLVKGDSTGARAPTDLSPAREVEEEGSDGERNSGGWKRGRSTGEDDFDGDYDKSGYSSSPDRISSSESGGYSKVRRREFDDDDDPGAGAGGGSAQGAAFV